MPSPVDYLTCLDCGHSFKVHGNDGNCLEDGCECFGYLWPDDE
jgi:hypothetical protein